MKHYLPLFSLVLISIIGYPACTSTEIVPEPVQEEISPESDAISNYQASGTTAPPPETIKLESGEWRLIWSDEFNGSGRPDPANWTHEVGIHPTSGSQHYSNLPENSYQENGSLIIQALEKAMAGHQYTSARITSENKFEFTYGRIEFRAKIPVSAGSWPALWLLGEDYPSVGWPASGEIDVMESVGYEAPYIHSTVHAPNYYWKNNSQQGSKTRVDNADTEFHLYAAEWFEDRIDFYVDDEKFFTAVPQGGDISDNDAWPFDKDHFIIMNICVDGDWARTPRPDSFPMVMEIDYVRVYEETNALGVPRADAGPDITKEDADTDGMESVVLDGSGSSDKDGEIIHYSWEKDGQIIAEGVSPAVQLTTGSHDITLVVTDNNGHEDRDSLRIDIAQQEAYTELTIPGTVEAEDFDTGGQGISYSDTSDGNSGGDYRDTDVDIQGDGDIYNVGWIADGEFLEYNLASVEPGTYSITLHHASANAASQKQLSVYLDGSLIAEFFPQATGGWAAWEEITLENIRIAGEEDSVLRLEMKGSEFNIDKLVFRQQQ